MSGEASGALGRIAWIGTGVMGLPMAGHLLDAGAALIVHTRTREKARPLLERGAAWAASPAEAADGADAAVSIVGYPDDVREVHLSERGTLGAAQPPRLIIDMTTSRPSLAVEIAREAAALGVGSVDAPVSGGDVGARSATLSIMVGGEAEHVERARPMLNILGKHTVHHGPPGAGQHAKMVNQILVAASMIGACEALRYAAAAGLDPMKVIESVSAGAAGSWTVSNLAPRMVKRDFEPGFFVKHFLKDLGIALEEVERMNLPPGALPGLSLARRLYEQAKDQGLGRRGTQALLLVYEQQSGKSSRPLASGR